MLDEYASHHLAKVLRFLQGQEITLFNGDGKNYLATLVRVKKYCEVEVHICTQNTSESKLDITLVQGIAKGEKLQKRMAHWQKIIIGACEQSARSISCQV
jgi:16S rRNA (uracil1498-N3)-methyltransferase